MNIDEKTLENLVSRMEKLEHENGKLRAYNEVMNITMKYFHYHQNFRDDLVVEECIAKTSPGIHAEHGASGVYEGYESVAKWWNKRPNPPGKLIFHAISTPVIEVADDLKTAKGIFLLNGFESGVTKAGQMPESMVQPHKAPNGKDIWAHWGWAKYGIDYILEDGEWKIWHFHAYDFCRATFDKDWVTLAQETAQLNKSAQQTGEGAPNKIMYATDDEVVYLPKADKPSTCYFEYDGLEAQQPMFPPMPKPYKTFDDTFEY